MMIGPIFQEGDVVEEVVLDSSLTQTHALPNAGLLQTALSQYTG
jgi:hypothetical protein